VPRLFRDVEAFERAMTVVPAHGLTLCVGCVPEIPTVDVAAVAVVCHSSANDGIAFVHFRDVERTVP